MTSQTGHRKAGLLAAAALVASPLLAGCGGTNPELLQSWMGTFCGSNQSIRNALSGANDSVRSKLEIPDLPLSEISSSYVLASESALESAATAKERISSAEAPPVDDGDAIKTAALEGVDETLTSLEALKTQAEAVPTDDRDAFNSALADVSQATTDESARLADSLKALDSNAGMAELRESISGEYATLDAAETCERLETPPPS